MEGDKENERRRTRGIARLVAVANVGVGTIGVLRSLLTLLPAAGIGAIGGGAAAPEAVLLLAWGAVGASLVLAGGLAGGVALRRRPALAFPAFLAAAAGGILVATHDAAADVLSTRPGVPAVPFVLTHACGLTALSIALAFVSLGVAFSTRSLTRIEDAPVE